jgi:hypothetical protein
MMGVAGWIIVLAASWAVFHNNGQVIRFSGGASWMSPGMRRFSGILLLLFGASLVVGSVLV